MIKQILKSTSAGEVTGARFDLNPEDRAGLPAHD